MVNVNEDVLEGLLGRALAQRPAHSLSEGGVEVAEAVVVARDIDRSGSTGKPQELASEPDSRSKTGRFWAMINPKTWLAASSEGEAPQGRLSGGTSNQASVRSMS